ncbi:MAG: hypothetical protein WAX69_02030 [Victivallales bacterium]
MKFLSECQFLGSTPLRKLILGCISFGALALCHAAEPAAQQSGSSGWAVHYYGEPTFWKHKGVTTVPGGEFNMDMDRTGRSFAAYAKLHVPVAGEYRFLAEKETGQAFLRVGGRQIDLDGKTPLALPAGEVPLALFIKPSAPWSKPGDNLIRLRLLWQTPGSDKMVPLPPEALSHDEASVKCEQIYAPDFPLNFEQGTEQRYAQRHFTVDLPEAGLYEIASHFSGIPRIFQVWLDGVQLLYVQGERYGVKDPVYSATDRTGAIDSQRFDFLHRARAVRPLSKGSHTLDVYAHYGPWIWNDEMKEAMEGFKLGVTRMGKDDPCQSLSVYPKDREDMVFKRGESLKVGVEQATDAPQVYRMEVVEQRGDGKILWQNEVSLKGGSDWARDEFSYPCDREGAFEYSVRDSAGRVVDGPWAFAVVDPTPLARPRNTPDGKAGAYRKELVDSVDCTQAADPVHFFRDNNTSKVEAGPGGSYRVTGTNTLRPIGYIKEGDSWRRVKEGEKKQAGYWAADWFAYTLKVKNPGRPHLVVGQVPNDIKRFVSMYATDQVTGNYNGWVLDAGEAPEAGAFSPLSFVVWPNGNAIDVCVWCSNNNHGSTLRQGAMAKIELYELPDGLPALPEAAGGWNKSSEFGWNGEQINLGVNERTMPSLWAGNDPVPGALSRWAWDGAAYHDWKALLSSWERFGQFSSYRGDNLCITPVYSYGMNFLQGAPELMLPKLWDIYSKGYGARIVDPMERDIFKLMLLTAQKYGVRLVADFIVHGIPLSLLTRQGGGSEEGILLTADSSGKPWISVSNAPMLNPAHPLARQYLTDLMDAMGSQYGRYPAFAGVRTRQWQWPSALDAWYPNENLGYDDFSVGLFAREAGISLPAKAADETAFKARKQTLLSDYRDKWLDWRCQKVLTLREEMLKALRKYAPQARLFSDGELNREFGLDPRLLSSRRDLGWGAAVGKFGGDGVEWNYPDPVEFANFDIRQPESLRGTIKNLVPDGRRYPVGMNCNQSYRSHPYQLEGPAMALAEGKLEACIYGGQWCLPPADEGLRRFVQAWRAIPPLEYTRRLGDGREHGPVACWFASEGSDWLVVDKREMTIYLVNRTPRQRQVNISFDADSSGVTDLVTGQEHPAGRRLQVVLDPFMPGVFKAHGVGAISELDVPAQPAELAKWGAELDYLRTLLPKTQGMHQIVYGGGERYTAADFGEWSRRDLNFSFDDLLKPMETAWQTHQPHEVARLLDVFQKDHLWWYETFGWPPNVYAPVVPRGQGATFDDLLHRWKWGTSADWDNSKPVEGGVEIPGFKGKFLTAPQGESRTIRFNPGVGIFELRIWGLFGGDYNPIKVEFMGKPIGQINVPYTKERQVHQALSIPLKWPWSPQDITLVGEGRKGLAISNFEVSAIPPAPIKRWQAIGLFDKKGSVDDWVNMEKVFPPEEKLDFSASYEGMGGKPISWHAIDIGDDKYIRLLEKYFPYDASQGNGVAYLATWVRLPGPSSHEYLLFYSMDWYGKAWLNGQLILPKISGPWKHFAQQKIQLKPGWNCLLVKTATGRAGWTASFAISDPGDLEYSGMPPQKEVK